MPTPRERFGATRIDDGNGWHRWEFTPRKRNPFAEIRDGGVEKNENALDRVIRNAEKLKRQLGG